MNPRSTAAPPRSQADRSLRRARPALRALALLAALHPACAPAPSSTAAPPAARPPASFPEILPPSPARYAVTETMGAQFDDEGSGAHLPRPEPAIIEGVRVLTQSGIILASAKLDDSLSGFRSLPARLGGGYILWSSSQTYKAHTFLGDLKPIAPAGASGGARPWLSSVLLRTDRGLLEVDPASLVVRRFSAAPAGIVDALAIDARRAARIDALGRASFTIDGGATWTDILAERGALTMSIREDAGGVLFLGTLGKAPLRLPPTGNAAGGAALLESLDDSSSERDRRSSSASFYAPPGLDPPSSRSFAPEALAHAAAAGALLPGGRALVGKQRGLALVSTVTGLPLADVELTSIAEHLTRCQPFVAAARSTASPAQGEPDVLLLCSHPRGAHVLRVERDMASPKLEATFPDPGVFIAGEPGRLAFAGRCGRTPPSSADFRAEGAPRPGEGEGANEEMLRQLLAPPEGESTSPAAPPEESPEEPPVDAPPEDDARVCVRAQGGTWIERRLTGDDALHLYRWLPGDDGTVTALLLESDNTDSKTTSPAAPREPLKSAGSAGPPVDPKPQTKPPEGVRLVRINPAAPALQAGRFPQIQIQKSADDPPYRAADPDFWLAADGSIRGWIHLRSLDEDERPPEPPPEEPRAEGDPSKEKKRRNLPLSSRSGGRIAGVQIGLDGAITLFPPPPDTEHVIHGGRFGLALAVKEDTSTYFETTDGGRSWLPVEGPPVGRLEPWAEGGPASGCSPVGCAVSGGVVRIGWGGPAPKPSPPPSESAPPSDPPSSSAAALPFSPPVLACRFEGEPEPWADSPRRPPITKAAPGRPTHLPPGGARPPKPEPAKPQGPLSILSSTSSPLGTRHEGTWSAEVIPPFSPGAGPRRVSVRDPSRGSMQGFVAPILTSAATNAKPSVDLLLVDVPEKQRLRLLGSSPSLLPFEQGSRVAVLVDLPRGDLAAFDADRAVLSLVPGKEAAQPVVRLVRVYDSARMRLTLARATSGEGLAVVGYSTTSGEVFAGALDLGRAEVAPLSLLGSLQTLSLAGTGACGRPGTYRFLADIPLDLRVLDKAGRELFRALSFATTLVTASGERLCAEGFEARVPRVEPLILSAAFTGGRAASVIRSSGGATRVTCSLEPGSGG